MGLKKSYVGIGLPISLHLVLEPNEMRMGGRCQHMTSSSPYATAASLWSCHLTSPPLPDEQQISDCTQRDLQSEVLIGGSIAPAKKGGGRRLMISLLCVTWVVACNCSIIMRHAMRLKSKGFQCVE